MFQINTASSVDTAPTAAAATGFTPELAAFMGDCTTVASCLDAVFLDSPWLWLDTCVSTTSCGLTVERAGACDACAGLDASRDWALLNSPAKDSLTADKRVTSDCSFPTECMVNFVVFALAATYPAVSGASRWL